MRLGLDLGGTKTEIIALADDGACLLRRRVTTPRDNYSATLATLASLVQAAEIELGCTGSVGVGIPGAESRRDGLIKNANSTWLNGQPLRQDIQALLQREVRLANDANCFALSEAADGAAAGADTVFGVILGTGVGGGVVVNGKPLVGANAIAGEWGHNYLPPFFRLPDPAQQPDCYCGRRGCLETYLSGPGMAADHAFATGVSMDTHTLVAAALEGDAACMATLQRYEARLAFALAQVVNLLDPDVIVLGGGLSNIARLYDSLPALMAAHVFSDEVRTRIVRNKHGDSSGVRGAAWLWPLQPA